MVHQVLNNAVVAKLRQDFKFCFTELGGGKSCSVFAGAAFYPATSSCH